LTTQFVVDLVPNNSLEVFSVHVVYDDIAKVFDKLFLV
jgi:hypothetical protein